MPDHYDERGIAPPSSATVLMIVIMSIVVLAASGYVIYNYSAPRPDPNAQSAPIKAP
jgi:hypothetical protein